MEVEGREKNQRSSLKHLEFVRAAALYILVCLANLYEYLKQNSGPLKSAVGTVEGAVTAVIRPVFNKFKGVPDDLLTFLDGKVDLATHKFDEHAPPLAKHIAFQLYCIIIATMQKAQEVVNRAQADGPCAAATYAASESKQIILHQTVRAWAVLDRFPLFHTAAELILPTTAHWSDKYNRFVIDMGQKGYAVFTNVPLIPVDDIAKAFKQAEASKEGEKVGDKWE